MHSQKTSNSAALYVHIAIRPFVFLLLLLLVVINTASAEPAIGLDNIHIIEIDEYNLWYQSESLDQSPTFQELSQLRQDAHQVPSLIGASGAYITKIHLTNKKGEKGTWFININATYLDIGTAYWQSKKGEIIALERFGQLGGDNPKLAHSQVFSLSVDDQESGTLWIYVQAKIFATPAIVKIYSKKEFYSTQFFINSITSISFTVMMALALIAFFIYLRTGYLVTLACSGYIGIQGIGWLFASGSLGHLITASEFNPVYIGIAIFPFAIASASQFTKLLFNCRRDHPQLSKIFDLLSIMTLLVGIVMPFLSFTVTYLLSHIVAMIWIPLCLGTGIFMLSRRDFRAKYYLIGNFLYAVSLIVYVLSHIYNIHWHISLEVIVQIALTIDGICILLSLAEWLQIQQKEFHRSYAISRIDPLTQVGNRFSQNEALAGLTGHYCIVFIDLDNFKKINDQLGHDEGDNVLTSVADIMQRKLHEMGSIFRCGGDEFVLIAVIEESDKAELILTKLSKRLHEVEQELQKLKWKDIGLSFGIATSLETINQSECLSLADQRMYRNKQSKK